MDAELILRVPLEEEAHDDKLAWHGELLGVFLVRSSYKLLQSEIDTLPLNNLQTEARNYYKKLWSLNLPTKVKNFHMVIL